MINGIILSKLNKKILQISNLGIKSDYCICIIGFIFSFFLASIIFSGWPRGLIPDLSVPYCNPNGDCNYSVGEIKRLVEGMWYFDERRGYPFGSVTFDFPGSDFGNLLVAKSLFFVDPIKAFNLFILLSFVATFISSYFVSRSFGISQSFSFVIALLYDFLPYHQLRTGHAYLEWYFVVPLYIYICQQILLNTNSEKGQFRYILIAITSMIIASFGVYYAFFGAIIIFTSLILSWFKHKSLRQLIPGVLSLLFIVLSVALNILPSIIYTHQNGKNSEVAQRSAVESDVFGLKLSQLILPRSHHRIQAFSNIRENYDQSFPLVNENSFSSLGGIAAIGLIIIGFNILRTILGFPLDNRQSLLAIIVYVLFLFSTIGGLGSLFSLLITPLIRSWNRVSVFIAYASLLSLFIQIELSFFGRLKNSKVSKYGFIGICVVILIIGMLDETTEFCEECVAKNNNIYNSDHIFIKGIENIVTPQAAIYQLPYMYFPESPAIEKLNSYDLLIGTLHSSTLKWSYGGMKGRDGDLFYRALSRAPLEKQVDVIKKLGFLGIYVDRRGYPDNGKQVEQQLTEILGNSPDLVSQDSTKIFFSLREVTSLNLKQQKLDNMFDLVGIDKNGLRYPASLEDGIDFAKSELPNFVKDIHGLSGFEKNGRWTDAQISRSLKIDLFSPLPDKYTLVLDLEPFGPNIDKILTIEFGAKKYFIQMSHGQTEFRTFVDLGSEPVNSILITPPYSKSPKDLGESNDPRLLGIFLKKLRIELK